MQLKHVIIALSVFLSVLLAGAFIYRYGFKSSGRVADDDSTAVQDTVVPVVMGSSEWKERKGEDVERKNCFLVVSKTDYKLYVCEVKDKDTLIVASFPVCYAKNKGQKTREGDCCTPECSFEHPFYISEIKNASTWCHDFKDGRGEILAYGKWFMRLDLSEAFPDNEAVAKNRSIGIHGSTNNESSVPGNASEGCIRLRDADLDSLHDNYAYEGQKVIVLPYQK